MKLLLENWKNFLNESVLGDYEGDLEFADDGDLILYHLSTSEDLTSLDPKVARERAKGYTQREYNSWERPRVFFFTQRGQEDTGVGRIAGKPYVAKVDPNLVYPVFKDPNGYNKPENRERYKKIRQERTGMAPYYPVNAYEFMATMAEEDGFHGFIYPQKGGGLIVSMWNPVEVEPLESDFYEEG